VATNQLRCYRRPFFPDIAKRFFVTLRQAAAIDRCR
jgi:hypothetical protein